MSLLLLIEIARAKEQKRGKALNNNKLTYILNHGYCPSSFVVDLFLSFSLCCCFTHARVSISARLLVRLLFSSTRAECVEVRG